MRIVHPSCIVFSTAAVLQSNIGVIKIVFATELQAKRCLAIHILEHKNIDIFSFFQLRLAFSREIQRRKPWRMDDTFEYHSATNICEIHNLFLLCSCDDEHNWIWWNYSKLNERACIDDFLNFSSIWTVWIYSECNRHNSLEFKESKWELFHQTSIARGVSSTAWSRHRT